MQTIRRHTLPSAEVQQVLHNILSAYFRTKPLEKLVDINDRSKRPMQLVYIALAGAECSSCVSSGEGFNPHLLFQEGVRSRENVVKELSNHLTGLLTRLFPFAGSFEENEILTCEFQELLSQAMCNHDADMIALTIL